LRRPPLKNESHKSSFTYIINLFLHHKKKLTLKISITAPMKIKLDKIYVNGARSHSCRL